MGATTRPWVEILGRIGEDKLWEDRIVRLAELLPSLDAAVPATGDFQAAQLPGESLAGGRVPVGFCSGLQTLARTGAEKSNEQGCRCP